MTIVAGYLVDLSKGLQFDEGGNSTWIQAMTVGDYEHPVHGPIKITPQRIQQFAANVKSRVRETDLDIDYDHKSKSGEAAGWVRDAEARPDGLWLNVEWTPSAHQKLKEKAYRYFSPEFVDEWKHPKTGQVHKDVLFGGGITNRPFLKDILPINMTEVIQMAQGGSGMDPAEVIKQIAAALKLPDDADPGVVLGHVQALMKDEQSEGDDPALTNGQPAATHTPPPAAHKPPMAASEEKGGQMAIEFTEGQLKQLQEVPFVKSLMETVASQGKALDEANIEKASMKLSESAASKGKLIPPVVMEGFKKQLSETPPALRDGLIKLFGDMVNAGQIGVDGSEKGFQGSGSTDKGATKQFDEAISKSMTEKKLSYTEAADLVARENPSLYTDYQRELAES